MVKVNYLILLLAIPSLISKPINAITVQFNSIDEYCVETGFGEGREWRCVNYRNFPTDRYNASTVEKLELYVKKKELPPLEKLTSEHLQLYKLPNLVELVLEKDQFEEIEPGAFRNGGKLASLKLLWNSVQKLNAQVFKDTPNLQKLEIRGPQFTLLEGFKFSELAKFVNLTDLILENVEITSLKSFENFKSLQKLQLVHIQLPRLNDREAFRVLKNLKFLTFEENSIRFVDPEVFADMENLEILNLSSNLLSEGFKNGTKFHNPNLIKLDLSHCQLKYIEEGVFENLGNLKELNLKYNRLGHVSQKMFSSLKNVVTLLLCGNQFKTLEPNVFSDLGNLKTLDLRRNQLRSLYWKDLISLKNISKLRLDGNRWQCDCQVFYLREFLKQRNIHFEDSYSRAKCTTFGAKGQRILGHSRRGFYMYWRDINVKKLNCLAFPNITKLSADKQPKLGESVQLECEFTGDLPLQVVWMKGDAILRNFTFSEDEPLQSNRTLKIYNDQLIIVNFNEEDAGLYKVVVSNEAGEIEESKYFNSSKEALTLDSANRDNAERNFSQFLQSLFEIMF